jgi:RNA polymerase sigma-70 factor (ECF subfamily)
VEPRAFEAWVMSADPGIRRLIGRLVGSRNDLDDLVQETYLRAWRARDHFRGDSRFSTWLYRIAVNVARTWRSRSRGPMLGLAPEHDRAAPYDPDPQGARLLAAYEGALARLPENLRVPFVLHEAEGLSYQDVAEVLACPIGTVMSRMHRARRALLEELQDELEN